MENIAANTVPPVTPQQPAPQAEPQAAPPKVRRVGTFTFGLTLIAAGVLLLCSILVPGFDPMPVWRLSPVVLIALGVEVLAYAARPGVKLKYDFLSMFACAFILLAVGGASIAPKLWDSFGPGHDARVRALNAQIEQRGVAALQAVPTIKENLYKADFYLQDYTDSLAGEQGTDLDAVIAAGACSANAHFTLKPGYATAEDFAADCAKVLNACKALPLKDCYFSTYAPENGTGAEPYQQYSLEVNGLWQRGASADHLAEQVYAYWYYDDGVFTSREELDRFMAEQEGEDGSLTEEELEHRLYQQGYDEGYAAAQADGGTAAAGEQAPKQEQDPQVEHTPETDETAPQP